MINEVIVDPKKVVRGKNEFCPNSMSFVGVNWKIS